MLIKCSFVIPCYNEEKNLPELVYAIRNFSPPASMEVEFVLVENGSTDNSRVVLDSLILDNDVNIKKVYVNVNQGYGYGIIQGLKQASGEYIGWLHADMQVHPFELRKFMIYICRKTETNGNMFFLKAKRKNRKCIERFFSWGMGIYESLLFGFHMYEVMATPVMMPKILVQNFEKLPKDFSIDIYVYCLAKMNSCNIIHIPVDMERRMQGRSSWNTGLKARIKQSIIMIKSSKKIRYRLNNDDK